MMRKALLCLLVALVPVRAVALNVSQLLATIAMPLAVAAVSNATHVPQEQLTTLVSALNQANMPPAQVVQVIRYVPVTLVDQNGQPFVAYVQQQTSQGVTGDALANAIAQQLQSSYGVTPQYTTEVTPSYVMSDSYIASPVASSDALSVIALPLAVAAVADIAGVPQDQLANLVATLNQANVPVVQEVHVIRYVPVALVSDNGQPFVQFVQQQVNQGVTGSALVPVVAQQLQTYYPAQPIAMPSAQTTVVEHEVPRHVIARRVEEVHAHPHGGPPGQLKKVLGLQTGAEVVHGQQQPVAVVPQAPKQQHGHGRGHDKHAPPMASSAPAAAPPAAPVVVAPRGKGHEGGPPGQQKDKGGKAKGHGKD